MDTTRRRRNAKSSITAVVKATRTRSSPSLNVPIIVKRAANCQAGTCASNLEILDHARTDFLSGMICIMHPRVNGIYMTLKAVKLSTESCSSKKVF